MVAQARDGPRAVAPQERRQPSTGDRASALELAAVVASGQRGLDQRSRDVARGPGAAGQEVGGCEPRGPRVESSARTARTRYDLLKKELPAGETGDGARSVVRCSNDCSPVEKMPRTFRSKSSALVAASRAVS